MRESDRTGVIRDVVEKRLTQREAALRLELSVRRVKRLTARCRERGAAGLVSGRRGKRSSNAINPAVRRACLGDLVRIVGSPHDWFEDRGPGCALIVYVDDATSRLLAMGFWAAETTEAYMFEGDTCQVTGHGRGYRLRGAAVTVCKGWDGAVTVPRDGRELPVGLLAEGGTALPVEDGKSVRSRVDRAKARQRSRPDWKPPPDHPWRRPLKTGAGATAG